MRPLSMPSLIVSRSCLQIGKLAFLRCPSCNALHTGWPLVCSRQQSLHASAPALMCQIMTVSRIARPPLHDRTCSPCRTLVDEKMAVKDAGEDLKQIAATLLETEQTVESRVGARAKAAAADVRDTAKDVVGEFKVRGGSQPAFPWSAQELRASEGCMRVVFVARAQGVASKLMVLPAWCCRGGLDMGLYHAHKCIASEQPRAWWDVLWSSNLTDKPAVVQGPVPHCMPMLRQGQARETSAAVRGEAQSVQAKASSSASQVHAARL